ncbi:MAG: 4-alpha-glucanotransferase [Nitrospinae bacterium]|nr:4-alpha-glucanotransferase [Nitrospinota bacterium]
MQSRASGLLLHISSLPSKGGMGDFGAEAYAFADFLAGAGQKYWQILPLSPVAGQGCYSPYFSSSAFAGNPLYINIDLLARDGYLSPKDIKDSASSPESFVDFEAVAREKAEYFEIAFRRFLSKKEPLEFNAFCETENFWLEDFALFSALREELPAPDWGGWPPELRDRRPKALAQARSRLKTAVLKHKFLQYLACRQWEELKAYCNNKGIRILGDLPIYVSYDSADVWAHPDIFKLDGRKRPLAVSGVPPDYFSATGQLWNNPVYRWDALASRRYDWWVQRLRRTFANYDITRIDHFRGLVQYWEVPAGESTAMNGEWMDVPVYDFFDELLSVFPDLPVIAEDLGIITPDVVEAKDHYGFAGMKVLLFAFGNDDPEHPYLPHTYEENCIAYTGTHDNNTFIGWFSEEASEEELQRLRKYIKCDGDGRECLAALLRILQESPAGAVIVPVQDLIGLGGEARMNNPAHPVDNWRWRLLPGQLTTEHGRMLHDLARRYGR